jgi:hypothetical protein
VEDGHALAPFHAFHSVAVYAWPIGISVVRGYTVALESPIHLRLVQKKRGASAVQPS